MRTSGLIIEAPMGKIMDKAIEKVKSKHPGTRMVPTSYSGYLLDPKSMKIIYEPFQ